MLANLNEDRVTFNKFDEHPAMFSAKQQYVLNGWSRGYCR
jgi:hypothetical protein